MRSGASGEPRPYSSPPATTSASASPNQGDDSHRFTKPGGAVSARSMPAMDVAAAAMSAAMSSGGRFWIPARRRATFVA